MLPGRYACFTYNAARHHKLAFALHVTLNLANVLTTVVALLYAGAIIDEDLSPIDRNTLMFVLPILPIVSGVLLTLQTRFSPLLKWCVPPAQTSSPPARPPTAATAHLFQLELKGMSCLDEII